MIEQITDYSVRNKPPYLIQFLRDSNFVDLLKPNDTQFNEIENTLYDLLLNMWIDTAEGEQLDVLGIHLDLPRDGREDENYRILLKVKAAVNTGSGEPEILIQTIKQLFNSENVEYTPVYPAKVQIWTDSELNLFIKFNMELDDAGLMELENGDILELDQPDNLANDIILQVLPAGVGLLIAHTFIWDDNTPVYLDNGDTMIVIDEELI